MLTIKKGVARPKAQSTIGEEAVCDQHGAGEACAEHGAENQAAENCSAVDQEAGHCCHEEAIRTLAYHKWQDAGTPASDGVEFWIAAEAEIHAGK